MADFSALEAVISGPVFLPESEAYISKIHSAWNGSIQDLRPAAFVLVKSREDVSQAVQLCVREKLEVCVWAGGNSDFALADDAVVIDLSDMKTVTVDVQAKTALVEGGTLVCDLDRETVKHKLATSLAGYSKLGVAGSTLLGGGAFLKRAFGSSADNVLEYELVTAKGEFIKASANENPDLFWGLKSLGFNFGIATLFKFQLHDIPERVVAGSLRYPVVNAKEVLKATRDFQREKSNNRLCIYMILHLGEDGPEVVLRFLFCGPPNEGEKLVEELQARTHPSVNTVGRVPLDEFQRSEDSLVPPGLLCHLGQELTFVLDLSDEVIDVVVEALGRVPQIYAMRNTTVYFQPLGGKLCDIPAESSPQLFGKAEYFVCFVGAVHDQSVYEAMKEWVDDVSKRVHQYTMVPDAERLAEVHKRLKELKIQYDPENVFRHNINIKP